LPIESCGCYPRRNQACAQSAARADAVGFAALAAGPRLFLRHPLLFLEVYLTLDPCRLYASPGRARKLLLSPELSEARVADYAARFGGESFRVFGELVYSLPNPGRIRGTPLLVLGGSNDAIVPVREIERTAEAYGAVVENHPRGGA
jgi:pimeloyl-ACP methyl ester carboxylesterase